ncbi:MAG: hypothetical protein KCHDKBKB_01418 [Elusimicrobia bacterium]|nr:hypothetical protein [Elusimicrobiota bacterium]
MSATPLPALKAGIEAIQVEHEGKPAILLRDQEGLVPDPVAVTLPGYLVAMMLDGQSTISDIQTYFSKNTGQLIRPEEIEKLVGDLEKAQLLETSAVQKKRREVWEAFEASPIRKPAHMKSGYPENRLDLATFLGKFFQDSKGPLKQMGSAPSRPTPTLLVAPHIDFFRGGPAYAWAYQALSECQPPDLIVALGVAHMSPNSPWVVTKKEYETPYGPVAASPDLVEDFKTSLWYDISSDQWVHRTEHSLEFQALWLKYLWRDKTPPWVPVLCSSFDSFCSDRAPSSIPSVHEGLKKLGEKLKARQKAGQKIMILAGIDLAHVGPRFGDNEKLGPELEKRVEAEDRKSLELALKGSADEMFLSVMEGGHWRKWCGLSALYTGLQLSRYLTDEPLNGRLLTYGQAPDPAGGLVSFTSLFYS